MRKMLIAAISSVALLAPGLNVQPACAQLSGDTAQYVTAGAATWLSPYYAPYALQAAAAYIDVKQLDLTRGVSQQPPLAGPDVELAVARSTNDEDGAKAARRYLRAWQYQFGSEGYLTCFESDPDCLKAIQKDGWTFAVSGGPTFQVWARSRFPQKPGAACSEVSIAFRGSTLLTADWISNLDPATGYFADDYYRQLRRNVDAIIKKITTLDCYKRARNRPQIVSVGHSLGGGLAQMAALANNPARPQIAKVFAFDPSPVTGASYVDKYVLSQNVRGLEIDRVYQSGEALQGLRKYAQQFPYKTSPCVRTVVYDAIPPAGPIALHNMPGLAREMVRLTSRRDFQLPYSVPDELPRCRSRYHAPDTDDDANPVLVSSSGGSGGTLVEANSARETGGYAMAQGFGGASAALTDTSRSMPRGKALMHARRPGGAIAKRIARL